MSLPSSFQHPVTLNCKNESLCRSACNRFTNQPEHLYAISTNGSTYEHCGVSYKNILPPRSPSSSRTPRGISLVFCHARCRNDSSQHHQSCSVDSLVAPAKHDCPTRCPGPVR